MAKDEEESEEELEEVEEGLEEEIQESEIDQFGDFMPDTGVADRAAPVLEFTGATQIAEESIEETAASAPTQTAQTGGEITDYQVQEYASGYEMDYSERKERAQETDREMNVTLMPVTKDEGRTADLRRIDFGGWQRTTEEAQMARGGGASPEEYVSKARRAGEEGGLPFEEKKRKRRLNI